MKVLLYIAVAFLMACSSNKKDEQANYESIIIHNSMIKKANQIEHHLKEIQRDTTAPQDSVLILLEALEDWKQDLVEVPGNEQHDHEGDHHDHLENMPDLTDEQMLQIQKELDARLSQIGKRASQLKPQTHVEHIH